MKIQITGKNLEVSQEMRKKIFNKLGSRVVELLDGFNFDHDTAMATVRVEKGERWGYKLSFSMRLPQKKHIYAEEKEDDFTTAVVGLREEVEKQLEKYRSKIGKSK
jgi:ribosomal subunit interface protein